ncbi:TPA: DUF6710 family protein [Vibrio vulnificus]
MLGNNSYSYDWPLEVLCLIKITIHFIKLSRWLTKFKTDGDDWIDTESSEKIGQVENYRNAAVFELGRLLTCSS